MTEPTDFKSQWTEMALQSGVEKHHFDIAYHYITTGKCSNKIGLFQALKKIRGPLAKYIPHSSSSSAEAEASGPLLATVNDMLFAQRGATPVDEPGFRMMRA